MTFSALVNPFTATPRRIILKHTMHRPSYTRGAGDLLAFQWQACAIAAVSLPKSGVRDDRVRSLRKAKKFSQLRLVETMAEFGATVDQTYIAMIDNGNLSLNPDALVTMDAPAARLDASRSYADDLVGAIREVGAEQEVRKLRDRSIMGRVGRTKKGLLPGRAPYGYVKTFDCETGEAFVEPDPNTAPIVREIFQRYLDGQGTHRIAAWLNEAGITAPIQLCFLGRCSPTRPPHT
jgi:hypothetical protein